MISKDAWEKDKQGKEEATRRQEALERRRAEIEGKWQRVFSGDVLELANDDDPEIQQFVKLYLKSTFAQAKQEKEREERMQQEGEEETTPSLFLSLWSFFAAK